MARWRLVTVRCVQCDARMGRWPVIALPICSPECRRVWDALVHSRVDDMLEAC